MHALWAFLCLKTQTGHLFIDPTLVEENCNLRDQIVCKIREQQNAKRKKVKKLYLYIILYVAFIMIRSNAALLHQESFSSLFSGMVFVVVVVTIITTLIDNRLN